MSVHLQSQEYFREQPEDYRYEPAPEEDPLLLEHGWPGVAQGLLRVVTGHLILVGSLLLGIAAMIIVASSASPADVQQMTAGASLAPFFISLAMGAAGLISYYYVLSGKWRCAMAAPERNNAKWLIFGCMVCLLLGPLISGLSSAFGDGGVGQETSFDASGNLQLDLGSSTSIMQIAGGVIGLASTICFVLFLRAIAACFDNQTLQGLSTGFLIASAVLIGFTLQSLVLNNEGQIPIVLMGMMGLGWIGCGVWYLVLIFMTRSCILNGLENQKSPLSFH